MSGPATNLRLDSAEPVRQFVNQWVESLGQVLESMTDRHPAVKWQAATGALQVVRGAAAESGPDAELLWWEQPFQLTPGSLAWIAAPRGVWEYAGTQTLKAAGVETVESNEARNTWFEIVGQSLGVLARALTAIAGREVLSETGVEHAPDPGPEEWASVSISFDDIELPPIWFALSPQITSLVASPEPEPAPAISAGLPADSEPPLPPQCSRTMELLLEVDLPISISFGRTQLPLKDVLKLTTGSIV